MEKHVSKDGVIVLVRELNAIIHEISYENCYDYVVKFFERTSLLDDYWLEIKGLPLAGSKIFGIKSRARKKAENDRAFFFKEIRKAGRDSCGYNRTEPGEEVTKKNLYFGGVFGLFTNNITSFEKSEDECVQKHIRSQIVGFVKSYKDSFKSDWLR